MNVKEAFMRDNNGGDTNRRKKYNYCENWCLDSGLHCTCVKVFGKFTDFECLEQRFSNCGARNPFMGAAIL